MRTIAFLLLGSTAFSTGMISQSVVLPGESVVYGEDTSDVSVVGIQDLAFTKDVLRVQLGQTVIWRNQDDFPHTATADDGSFDTGTIAPGEQAQITFNNVGTFPYFCEPHPFMKASVIVEK